MLEQRPIFGDVDGQLGSFVSEKAKDIIRPLVQRLAHMHSQGTCLREIRPENIIIDSSGAGPASEFYGVEEVPASPTLMTDNMIALSDIIVEHIFLNDELPICMARLVQLMRFYHAESRRPLIRNHVALVPQVERGLLFF